MAVSSIAFSPNPGTRVRQLFVLLHDAAGSPEGLEALGLALRVAFPGAAVLIPAGPQACDGGRPGRQWFSEHGVDEANRPARVAQALPALIDYVRAAQHRLKLRGADTALAGFGQGATLALEAVQAERLLAGRVLAFGGRYASLPATAPRYTTIHLLHGAQDAVVPVRHAQAAQDRLAQLQGDATIDVAWRVGHELHPALVRQAIVRLKTCVPLRKWAQALQGDPAPPAGTTLH
ncbi:esterase [Orrella sp. JC864]|uniref:esterase n=1 Tax=Orrella sp. JC864 TaxID=3120298 RepID=UPI0012BD36BE